METLELLKEKLNGYEYTIGQDKLKVIRVKINNYETPLQDVREIVKTIKARVLVDYSDNISIPDNFESKLLNEGRDGEFIEDVARRVKPNNYSVWGVKHAAQKVMAQSDKLRKKYRV